VKANVRIIIAAAALVAVVFAVALVTSRWDDGGRPSASFGPAIIPQPSVDNLRTRTVEWHGQQIKTLQSRFVVYLNGRIYEVAVDDYAQSDDGAVWYFSMGANDLFDAIRSQNWNAAGGTAHRMNAALAAVRAGEVPQRIYTEVNNALDSLNGAVRARRARQGSSAALDVAQASVDLQLRHRPAVVVNVSRVDWWARQLQVDAAAGDSGAATGDVATLPTN
jgi:hypothetical protein